MIFANRIAVLALLVGVLAGCATGPKYEEVRGGTPSLAADKGRIYFYRSGKMMGWAIQPSVMLNGEKVGDSKPGGFFFVDCTPGSYEVNLTTEVVKRLTFMLDAGQEQYVRMSVGLGVLVYRVYPELVDKTTADRELKGLSFTGQQDRMFASSQNRRAAGNMEDLGITLTPPAARDDLSKATRQVSYSAPDSIARRLVEFNVLRYAFADPKTGEITLIGIYDPAYASGPIPYYDLLADALRNPYPKFSLEYDPSDPAVRRIQQTIDNEMSRVTRDVSYGAAWMKRLMTATFDPQSQPEDRLVLEQRLRKLGIPPDVFTAYMAWDGESGLHNSEFRQKMGLFTAKLLAGVGIDERVGYGIIALKDFERAVKDEHYGRAPADGEPLVNKTIRLFTYLGIESDFHRLRQEMAAGKLQGSRGTTELLACVYGGLLRGLQVPESEVSSLIERYRAGRIPEQVLTDKKNARYAELGARSLSRNLLNGFRFSGKHLSRIYSLPPVMSGVKLFGSPPDSPVMRVFFDGDYTLKYITSAAADSKSVPGAMSFDAYLGVAADRAGSSAGRLPTQGVNRYWIFPGSVQMEGFSDGSGVRFVTAKVRIGAESLQESIGSDSRGAEFYRRTLNQYGEQLTSQYDTYARVYPSLHVIRETEKVIALARWIKSRRVPLRVPEAKPANMPVPQRVEGFWGLTYIVRPTGTTDNINLWIQGGVAFSQQEGDGWMQVTPSVTATRDVLHQLSASAALAEQASAAALSGNMESARDLAQRSADAMTGQIDMSRLPEPVMVPVLAPNESVARRAEVAQSAIAATEMNTVALAKARADLQQAEPLKTTDPARYAQIQQQSQQMQSRSEANLSRLQSLLQKYRSQTAAADDVAVDLRNLDPNKPIVVAPLPSQSPTAKKDYRISDEAYAQFLEASIVSRQPWDQKFSLFEKSIKTIEVPKPEGPRRVIDEGVFLGLWTTQSDANALLKEERSPLPPFERYSDMQKRGRAMVISFGIGRDNVKMIGEELFRGIADHLTMSYTTNLARVKNFMPSLEGTHFKRLIAHSNGATVAEALIRQGRITVDELHIAGGDRSLISEASLKELMSSGKVKRVVVWVKGADPVPIITATGQSRIIENVRAAAFRYFDEKALQKEGIPLDAKNYQVEYHYDPQWSRGLSIEAHFLREEYLPWMRGKK